MKVKLHRCSAMWAKIGGHPCWRVQRELDAAGIEYEVVPGPVRRSKRDALDTLSGQRSYPVIEFEDGSIYRTASKHMAARIQAGELADAPRGVIDHDHEFAHGHHHDHEGHDHAH
ncbi:MAG: hypothetical protein WCH31_08430 [Actinomycetes bacterium]